MKKKMYDKPTTKVYVLNQQPELLAGSFESDRNNPYGTPEGY